MKLLLEILLSIFLHPIAFVLALVNIAGRPERGPEDYLGSGVFFLGHRTDPLCAGGWRRALVAGEVAALLQNGYGDPQ